MIRSGLVSITFRKLSPTEIIDLCVSSGIEGIEWGGDVHVPPGDVACARDISKQTNDAGKMVSAYGSYYRLGDPDIASFQKVLESAVALGAPMIRVWAGGVGSDQCDAGVRQQIIADTQRVCDLSELANIKIVTEWHGGTLTDTGASARQFFSEVNHRNLFTYWQPRTKQSHETSMSDIEIAMKRIAGLHVFSWADADATRCPLIQHADRWQQYLSIAKTHGDFFAGLEFIENDSIDQFHKDAKTLITWLNDLTN